MKMKKKILSVAVLVAMGAGTAQAVNLSADGTGQVILFPYFTAQGNEETYLQVINTHNEGKAVKIRFREAYNSREVLAFNIYLSPYDVWTGVVLGVGDGAGIATRDTSCTAPDLTDTPVAFRTSLLQNDNNGDITGAERTREGYVEIIEMGVVTQTGSVVDADNDGHADYVHIGGVPENCETMINNWRPGGAWAQNPASGITAPSGGLFGALSVINVSSGTQVSVNATSLEAVFASQQHADPGTNNPTLANADATSVVMLNNGPAINGQGVQVFEDSWISSTTYAGINAVSATLMAQSVMNGYSVNPANEAESAWVVTFPTKWAYADQDEIQARTGKTIAVAPFTDTFQDRPLSASLWDNEACEKFDLVAWDREEKETTTTGDVDFSPARDNSKYLCYEVNVIQFEDSSVFDSANTTFHANGMPGKNGWMSLGFNYGQSMGASAYSVNDHGNVYTGLPVIGFKAKVLGNGQLEGAGSYASAVDHVYERIVSGASVTAYSQN